MYYFNMATGFPSPAQGYEDNILDLNTLFIKHPAATFFMTVETDRYRSIGIYNGDLVIIDRAQKICPTSLVVYEQEGEFVIGKVCKIKNEAQITGAIINVVHTVKT